MKKLTLASLLAVTLTGCFNTYNIESATSPMNEPEMVQELSIPEAPITYLVEDFESDPVVEADDKEDVVVKEVNIKEEVKNPPITYSNPAAALLKMKRTSPTSWGSL
jgi:hypothetical protein